jgi:hypothetical protein
MYRVGTERRPLAPYGYTQGSVRFRPQTDLIDFHVTSHLRSLSRCG